ncbi:helix-turn-helix transcriptional regulator [Nocardia sp. NPDC051052]|uniref:helix-turn-helix transcriptional regulator n=1 Tax=Nocardia sp. NPDC051052 TaxID=3364322 RepID=UPI0037BD2F59
MSVTVDGPNEQPGAGAADHPGCPALSARELEVLLAWLRCDTKVEVGRRLYISLGTVNTYLSRVREKYVAVGRPAPTKAALVARLLQDGLIDIAEL